MKKLVIIGASGHGKVIADIAEKNDYDKIVFLDDNKELIECAGFPVVGTTRDIHDYYDWDFIVAIGNADVRQDFHKKLDNYSIVTLIHPASIVSRRVTLGKGTVVMAGTVINSDVNIGDGCIINTSSSIDHDCKIASFAHISVGAHVAGTVTIGEKVWVGAGAVITNNISICDSCVIGAGGVVIKSLDKSGIYIGSPVAKYK